MSDEFTKEYWIRKNQERKILNIKAEQQTFMDWLLERYQTTPITLRVLCKQTARFGSGRKEYESLMEWYRRRYRWEMEQRTQLIKSNPFKEEK